MARLHEYQGKGILASNAFKIPRGRAASVANIKNRPLYPFTNLMFQRSSLGFHQACKHMEARKP
jgi:hypothetical protein